MSDRSKGLCGIPLTMFGKTARHVFGNAPKPASNDIDVFVRQCICLTFLTVQRIYSSMYNN